MTMDQGRAARLATQVLDGVRVTDGRLSFMDEEALSLLAEGRISAEDAIAVLTGAKSLAGTPAEPEVR